MAEGNPCGTRALRGARPADLASLFQGLSLPTAFSAAVFLLCCLSCVYIYSQHFCGPPIRSDGYGYYAYLPSLFIDHDLAMRTPQMFRWTVVGSHPLPYNWDGIAPFPATGRPLDKYTVGTALLQLPFFLAAHLISHGLSGVSPNGYSWPYQAANALAAIFYFSMGTWLLLKLLLSRFGQRTAMLTALAVVFGTSAFHYATYAASFSHAYSFFLVSLLLCLLQSWREAQDDPSPAIMPALIGVVLGLIVITRVTDAIIGLIPLCLAVPPLLKSGNWRRLLLQVFVALCSFAAIFSIQSAYWYAQTGHFLVNSYRGEYFNWGNPQIIGFLFSIKAGLFFWAPILLLAIPGFPLFVRDDRALAIGVGAVLLLEIYVCASWWMWSFGSNYGGGRPFVNLLPAIAIPLGYGIEWLTRSVGRTVCSSLVVALVALNIFLMISKWHNYISWSEDTTLPVLLSLPGKWL